MTSDNFTFLKNKLFQFFKLLLNSPVVYILRNRQNTTFDHAMSVHIHLQGTLHSHSSNSNYRRSTLNNFEMLWQCIFRLKIQLSIQWNFNFWTLLKCVLTLSAGKIYVWVQRFWQKFEKFTTRKIDHFVSETESYLIFSYQHFQYILVKHNHGHMFALLWSHLSDNFHYWMNDRFYSKNQTHHKMHIFLLFRYIASNTLRSFFSILLDKHIMSRWSAMAYRYCEV